MNLKTLALVASCMTMPALAGAQDMMKKDSMHMKKDSMQMKKHDMDMKKNDMDMKKTDMDMDMSKSNNGMKTRTRARGSRRSARGMEMNNSQMNMTNGPECARGCPTSPGVGGLTGVQFLALQQELRDRGCGNNHVTGVLDAPTRAAIRACAKKWNVEATPAAVLTKMNIGYSVGG